MLKYDVRQNRAVEKIDVEAAVAGLGFSPCGKYFVVGLADGKIQIY